ncbi:Predicted kinase [Lentzea xinjiangensis]|uniref:Predicted kinase n=1 Tax=Lentzea xinjiangensis TaxID=402600 RepID=A0A1H9LYT0_9PSEU|nr:ATP-binding protein [Lentzea xinjiangensis]SER16574.1 Predicted kinase [Lentzea xinjiangensis]
MTERAFRRYLDLEPSADEPVLVPVAGVPGSGKSTLAESLARHRRGPILSMDWVLGTMTQFSDLTDETAGSLVDLNLFAAAARHVQLGIDVVVDATAHTRGQRDRWRELTERLGGTFVGVECVCSDERLHRERVEGRDRGIPGWYPTVPWEHVQRMRDLWELWEEDHLVLDSAVETPADALERVLAAVRDLRSAGETAGPATR